MKAKTECPCCHGRTYMLVFYPADEDDPWFKGQYIRHECGHCEATGMVDVEVSNEGVHAKTDMC